MVMTISMRVQAISTLTSSTREFDGVLQQVAEAVHDLRPARQHRIARLRRVGRELDAQRDVRPGVRRRRQFHQQAGGQEMEMVLVLVRLARQLGQDLAAALALARPAGRRRLRWGESAGRSRASSLAIREMVPSGEPSSCAAAAASAPSDETRCSRSKAACAAAKRIRQPPQFLRHAIDIEGEEDDREDQRDRERRDEDVGDVERAVRPGQRLVLGCRAARCRRWQGRQGRSCCDRRGRRPRR